MLDTKSDVSSQFSDVKALLFDVFGTVVDWRSTVTGELVKRAREQTNSPDEWSRRRLQELTDDDWAEFAQEWRISYMKFTRAFEPGITEWKDIDTHHRDSLIELLRAWGIAGAYTDAEVKDLSLVWHHLEPWADSSKGLNVLGTRFVTSTLSNGNQSLLKDLDEHGKLGFQNLISSADFKAYKPHPKTYRGAAEKLAFTPGECAMVAAHLGDLKAARTQGLKTIYIERPGEEGQPELIKEARTWVDLWITEDEEGFVEVARRLGIDQR
ncbi:haloacid dehalogenase [Xylariales sp. AK1849]|nr:haloacid dehalogenase [Xylariales sp. AK1849]